MFLWSLHAVLRVFCGLENSSIWTKEQSVGFISELLFLVLLDAVGWLVMIKLIRQILDWLQKFLLSIELLLLSFCKVLKAMWTCKVGWLCKRNFLDFRLIEILVSGVYYWVPRFDFNSFITMITDEWLWHLKSCSTSKDQSGKEGF